MTTVHEVGGDVSYETWRSFRRARRAGLGVSGGTLRASCPACWGQGSILEPIEQGHFDIWAAVDLLPIVCAGCRGTGQA